MAGTAARSGGCGCAAARSLDARERAGRGVGAVSLPRRRRASAPRPRAHRHVAGWLQKAPQVTSSSSDAPQTPPAPLERALRFVRARLQPPLVSYETGCAGADPAQLLALWEAAGVAPRGATAERVATALRHSFACTAAYAATSAPPTAPAPGGEPPAPRVLVGFARTVSDGQFAAVVTDIAVAAPWRRSGVGRELMRRLLRATAPPRLPGAQGDGPASVAAFPPPHARAFFARCGLRRNPRYRWMRLRVPGAAPHEPAAREEEEERDEAVEDMAAAMAALWTPLPGANRGGGKALD